MSEVNATGPPAGRRLTPAPRRRDETSLDFHRLATIARPSFALLESTRARRILAASLVILGLVGWWLGPLTALVAAVATSSFLVGWRRPLLVPPLVVVLLPVARLDAVPFDVRVRLLEAMVGAVAAGYALHLARQRRLPDLNLADLAFFTVVLAVIASEAANSDDVARSLHEILLWGGLAVVFHASSRALRDRGVFGSFLAALALVAVFEGLWAIAEYIHERPERHTVLDGAVVARRSEGTLEHANFLGLFLALSLLALLGPALSAGRRLRIGLAAASTVAAVGVATTFSRGAWAALLAGFVVFALDKRPRRALFWAAGGIAMTFAALIAADESFRERLLSLRSLASIDPSGFRLEMWRRAVGEIADHPLLGAATFSERALYGDRMHLAGHPHNLWLALAALFGLIAAVGFTVLLVLSARAAASAWRRSRENEVGLLGLGLLASVAALVTHGIFDYPFASEPLMALIVLLLAAAIAVGSERGEETRLSRRLLRRLSLSTAASRDSIENHAHARSLSAVPTSSTAGSEMTPPDCGTTSS